jgi:hypothetical protein
MEVLHDEALLAAACTLHVALHATLRRFDTAVDAHAPHWWSGSPSLPSAVEAVEPAVEAVEPAVEAVEPAVEAEAVERRRRRQRWIRSCGCCWRRKSRRILWRRRRKAKTE